METKLYISVEELATYIIEQSDVNGADRLTEAGAFRIATRMLASDTLYDIARQAIELIRVRGDYVSQNPESERPSFRTIAGCVGEETLAEWEAALALADGGKEQDNG